MATDDKDEEKVGEVLSELDPILDGYDLTDPPAWVGHGDDRVYAPDYDLARELLAIPIGQGYATKQQSGRVAKALDAWIAQELRRAGFDPDDVWPRTTTPRVLPGDLIPAQSAIDEALDRLDEFEDRLASFAEAAARKGLKSNAPSLYQVRPAIHRIMKALPGASSSNILGRFYVKQVDVAVSSWQRGPDVLISSKTAFSSYLNNKNNRYEEAVGEATNLRHRHPMAAMGFVFLVRSTIFNETGAFAYLRDLLVRLRKPDGDFDATMLLVADWSDEGLELESVTDASDTLAAPRFFSDLLGAVMRNAPVDLHTGIRRRRDAEPPGGLPPEEDLLDSDT